MGVSHVGNSEAQQMTKSVNARHIISSSTVTDASPGSLALSLAASGVYLCTAHFVEHLRCRSIREVQRKSKVFSCFRAISTDAQRALLGILRQAFADLTANGMKVHCL